MAINSVPTRSIPFISTGRISAPYSDRVPHIQVDFMVGGVISQFFIQQVGRFVAEVEIEAYMARPPQGDIIWNKKIGYREVRIPFSFGQFHFSKSGNPQQSPGKDSERPVLEFRF